MHLQVVQIVTFIAAFAISATRILTASKPFWSYAPSWLTGLLPGLLVAIPALGQGVIGAQSWTDLTVAFLVAGALMLPGIHSHTVAITKPNGPGSATLGAGLALILAASFFVLGACSLFGAHGSVWPAIGPCAPTTEDLFSKVESVLTSSTGDYESDLLALGKAEGLQLVECAVQAVLDKLGTLSPRTADESVGAARAKAFLDKRKAEQ